MRTYLEPLEKEKYRTIEDALFDKEAEEPAIVIKKRFTQFRVDPHTWLGSIGFFTELCLRFRDQHSSFCIATSLEEEPIILFDLREDSFEKYTGILYTPKNVGLSWPDPNAGIMITNERIFFYNPDKHWCLYADRYEDMFILAY